MVYSKLFRNQTCRGFTLIELLVVIAIIAILAVVVFVALDPATRFADARNSRRWSDVNSVLTAVHECIVDSGGSLTTCGLTNNGNTYQLGTDATGCNTLCSGAQNGCLDLGTELNKYLKSIPLDPSDGSAGKTAYSVNVDSNNLLTVTACSAESSTISIAR